jgi:hypothetical protein
MKTLFLAVALLGLAACTEAPQVVVHEQGRYQGKADTPPWGEGDREAWEQAIKARQLTQNEYGRMY